MGVLNTAYLVGGETPWLSFLIPNWNTSVAASVMCERPGVLRGEGSYKIVVISGSCRAGSG